MTGEASGPTMRVSYWDPVSEATTGHEAGSAEEVIRLAERAWLMRSGRERPAVLVERTDGSSLSCAVDDSHAFLVWIEPDGFSQSSIGDALDDELLIFDHFGSWSEARPESKIGRTVAIAAIAAFCRGERPDVHGVRFEPD